MLIVLHINSTKLGNHLKITIGMNINFIINNQWYQNWKRGRKVIWDLHEEIKHLGGTKHVS
jgi:hypothetical protein